MFQTNPSSLPFCIMDSSTAEFDLPEGKETITRILQESITPLNVALFAIICVLAYKIIKRFTTTPLQAEYDELPRIRKDMMVAELRQYDGNQPDGRVLVAVNGWIFDATRGRRFYGPGECICIRRCL